MSRIRLLFAACLAVSGLASGQITVEPSAPKAFETVRVLAPLSLTDFYYPSETQISMEANRIKISLEREIISPHPFTPDLNVSIGQFPAGTYDVVIVRRLRTEPEETVGTARFVVSERPGKSTAVPAHNYSDHWWNPAESGWGLVITQHTNDIIFLAWYVYASDGKPMWYVIPSGEWTSTTTYAGTIYEARGPGLGVPFDPMAVKRTAVGSGTLAFSSFDKATFTYTVDGVTGTKSIVRFAF